MGLGHPGGASYPRPSKAVFAVVDSKLPICNLVIAEEMCTGRFSVNMTSL